MYLELSLVWHKQQSMETLEDCSWYPRLYWWHLWQATLWGEEWWTQHNTLQWSATGTTKLWNTGYPRTACQPWMGQNQLYSSQHSIFYLKFFWRNWCDYCLAIMWLFIVTTWLQNWNSQSNWNAHAGTGSASILCETWGYLHNESCRYWL